jgi:hypothetical protein
MRGTNGSTERRPKTNYWSRLKWKKDDGEAFLPTRNPAIGMTLSFRLERHPRVGSTAKLEEGAYEDEVFANTASPYGRL